MLSDGTLLALPSSQYPSPPVNNDFLGGAEVVRVVGTYLLDSQHRVWQRRMGDESGYGEFRLLNNSVPGTGEIVDITGSSNNLWLLDSLGRLYKWIDDGESQHLSPIDQSALAGAKITHVVAGSQHLLFTDSASNLWSLGNNAYGQLGNGTSDASDTPVLVGNLVNTASPTADLTALPQTISLLVGREAAVAIGNIGFTQSQYFNSTLISVDDAYASFLNQGKQVTLNPGQPVTSTLLVSPTLCTKVGIWCTPSRLKTVSSAKSHQRTLPSTVRRIFR